MVVDTKSRSAGTSAVYPHGMRILMCGDRNWTNPEIYPPARVKRQREIIIQDIEEFQPSLVIEGDARGADRVAGREAHERGIPVRRIPAEWTKYGRAAGPIRNAEMLKENPELVIAYHNDIDNSAGTRNMVEQARKKGVPVIVRTDAETEGSDE